MRKPAKKDLYESRLSSSEFHQAVSNVENYKRQRSLSPNSEFFEKVLAMKKLQDFVFITKTAARGR